MSSFWDLVIPCAFSIILPSFRITFWLDQVMILPEDAPSLIGQPNKYFQNQ
jgi:hypothetical protein